MTSKSSIHIIPIKANSQAHNFRETKLDYVREDLTKDNTSFVLDQISNRLETIKSTYKAHVGQNMQKKATPIREAVVNLKDASPQTMNDLKKLDEKAFTGMKAAQDLWKAHHVVHQKRKVKKEVKEAIDGIGNVNLEKSLMDVATAIKGIKQVQKSRIYQTFVRRSRKS